MIVYYSPGYVDNKLIASFNFVAETPVLWDLLKRSFLSINWLKWELINEPVSLRKIRLDKFKMKAHLKRQWNLDNISIFKRCRKAIDLSKKETGISKNHPLTS